MPSTAKKVSGDPRVVEVWDEGKDGKWAELATGYCSNLGTHQLHERTWLELYESVAGIERCSCQDCIPDGT